MAVTQGNVLQQPPVQSAPPATEQAPNVQSNVRPVSGSQMPTPAPQAQQPAGGNATQAQAPGPDVNFSQIIEQQIAQAIQPILDEFRQNAAQAVMNQQAAPTPAPAIPTSGAGAPQATPQGHGVEQPAQQQGAPASGQHPAGQATQQPQPQSQPQQAQLPQQAPAQPQPQPQSQPQSQPQPQQAPAQPQQQAQSPTQATGSGGQASARPEGGDQQGLPVQAPLTGALHPALQAVEHQGAQWLQATLVAGLGALLTEATHAAIQQRAEQGLHALLQKLFEAAPDNVTSPEMQTKTERTLQTILRESLDALFAGGMRSTVQQGGQQAIQESLHGEFGSALNRVQDTLKAMAEALLNVLRSHWQSVLRLLLALVLLGLENSLAQSSADKQARTSAA